MDKLYIIFFVCFIGFFSLYNVLKSDVSFSEGENRELANFPEFKKDNILSGKFSKDFETYLTDNFKGKEKWLLLKSISEKSQLRVKSNGIYYGKNKYLLEEYKEPGEQLGKNLSYIEGLGVKINLLLLPTSVSIYENYLPKYAESYSQKEVLNSVKEGIDKSIEFIDVYDKLISEKDSYIYFRNDHHWTMRGAYIAYLEYSKNMGFEPHSMEDFNIDTVSEDFMGTYYSKVNTLGLSKDIIEVFNPKFKSEVEITFEENGKVTNKLYDERFLNKKDKYSYFLHGNNSLMTINTNIKNGKKLLVIKDSYAHIFIPFLTYHYEEIHVVDLRYYKYSIKDYIKDNNITESLVLYNLVNFSEDKDLVWLKKW